ncbi:MAG TPA: hypothetical protein VJN88_02725 [Ktedonobacterales bacterium]|nr:hypothetical protein [Ktedonobacterales bacterium]
MRPKPTSPMSGTGIQGCGLIGRLALGTFLFSSAGWIETTTEGARSAPVTLLMVALALAGLALLWSAAARPRRAERPKTSAPTGRLPRVLLTSALTLSAAATIVLGVGLIMTNTPANAYGSDDAAFNHYNARLALDGVNPYTADGQFWAAVAAFPHAGATPLRRGRYANSRFGPSLTQLVADVRAELANPASRGPEFDPASLHSYPALAFLVNVPALALGSATTLPVSFLALVAFLLAAVWGAPRSLRGGLWLALLSNQILVLLALRGSFDIIALLPALLAWRTLDRRWLSPILLGVACAVKQLVWPLLPLYAVIVWRRDGPRAALTRLGVVGVAFLVPNAPFIVAGPGAWLRSMLLPVTLPEFPSGIGLVAFARAGLLPLFPSMVYTTLEVAALVALVVWFARARTMPRPELALIVGLLPFLLAWHSATTYFAAIPALAVYASIAARAASGDPSTAPGSSPVGAADAVSVVAITPT